MHTEPPGSLADVAATVIEHTVDALPFGSREARRFVLRCLWAAHHTTHAVVDLRVPTGPGLPLVRDLCQRLPELRVVILTGYGSIATAVNAIRLGGGELLDQAGGCRHDLGRLLSRRPCAAGHLRSYMPESPAIQCPISAWHIKPRSMQFSSSAQASSVHSSRISPSVQR